jgi:hypothetical protein
MAITLVTGQPGHGKTQWAIAQARKFVKDGRTVFAGNVRGLKYEAAGFVPLERFDQWESLPDGSVVLWDECYDALPQRGAGRPVPPHVEALARHRHRGFDFLLICQQPRQIDSFVSGLVERHVHCRRRFGTSLVRIREWDKMEREPERGTALVTATWTLDRSVWPLYESATVHTVKRRIPWYVYALPITLCAVLYGAYSVPAGMVERAQEDGAATGAAATGAVPGLVAGAASEVPTLRQTDPMAYMRPRVAGAPWTAPAYDGVELGPPPQLACMSSAKRCVCVTADQGTQWLLEEDLCRLTARYGRYDPTRKDQDRPTPKNS